MIDEPTFLVLNAVYLKKMTNNEQITSITGLPQDNVRELTKGLAANGYLVELPDGVMLMPPGTEAVLEFYRTTYKEFRETPLATQWYEKFEIVNSKFIALVSKWQEQNDPGTENRLFQQVEKLQKLLGEIVDRIPRYGEYIRRFNSGIDLVDRGNKQYVCNPTIDSVHNIWFEFHEDILAVVGRPRDTT